MIYWIGPVRLSPLTPLTKPSQTHTYTHNIQPGVHEESEPRVAFSGEEVFGKYLDLQALHAQYLALPQTADKVRFALGGRLVFCSWAWVYMGV